VHEKSYRRKEAQCVEISEVGLGRWIQNATGLGMLGKINNQRVGHSTIQSGNKQSLLTLIERNIMKKIAALTLLQVVFIQ
jgi:hypothetical protein